jgi:hypothetical protein
MLVRVGQQFARERIKAHVSLLLGICELSPASRLAIAPSRMI